MLAGLTETFAVANTGGRCPKVLTITLVDAFEGLAKGERREVAWA